jgi:hypothetical protein
MDLNEAFDELSVKQNVPVHGPWLRPRRNGAASERLSLGLLARGPNGSV